MKNRVILSLCGTALALLAPYAQAQFGGQPSKLELIKVRDDIYVISNVAVPGLVTALITNEGVLLVDDKFEIDHDNIIAMLKTVTNQPVKYVINTHYHGDHSGGNAKLQAIGTLAVASIEARASMVAANQSGQPNITVGEHPTIHIGGKTVEIHKVGRAHTERRRRRAVPGAPRARRRRHLRQRPRHLGTARRLPRRRQRQGVAEGRRASARAGLRHGDPGPRLGLDESRSHGLSRLARSASATRWPQLVKAKANRAPTSRWSCAASSTGKTSTSRRRSTGSSTSFADAAAAAQRRDEILLGRAGRAWSHARAARRARSLRRRKVSCSSRCARRRSIAASS